MSVIEIALSFESNVFWQLYDEYITVGEFRNKKLNQKLSEQLALCSSVRNLCRPGETLRPIVGWVALRSQDFFNDQSRRWLWVVTGDVLIEQHDWDREVLLTHSPGNEYMGGSILRYHSPAGEHEAKDLFIPIFDFQVLEAALTLRLAEEKTRIFKAFDDHKKFLQRH